MTETLIQWFIEHLGGVAAKEFIVGRSGQEYHPGTPRRFKTKGTQKH